MSEWCNQTCVFELLEPRLLLSGSEVHGLVWTDTNGDGLRDVTDPGINGWVVELLSAETSAVVDTTSTADRDLDGDELIGPLTETGVYFFSDVPAGDYWVRCTPPGGWAKLSPPETYDTVLEEVDSLFSPAAVDFDFTGASSPLSDATVTIKVIADLDGDSEYLMVMGEDGLITTIFNDGGLQYQQIETSIILGQADLARWALDGTVSISIQPSLQVSNLGGSEWIEVGLSYEGNGYRSVQVVGDSGEYEAGDFSYFEYATIEGTHWNDLNHDGVVDTGEPGLAGLTVELLDPDSQDVLAATTTDADGGYRFDQLLAGPFEIVSTAGAGWAKSLPVGGSYTANLSSGQLLSEKNFGSFEVAEMSGLLFDDANGDGVLDAGETGLDGWVVELFDPETQLVVDSVISASVDLDLNGQIDPHLEQGLYEFVEITPGDYEVRVIFADIWSQTSPAQDPFAIALANGQVVSDVHFGFDAAPASIDGLVFSDIDGDGKRGLNEEGTDGIIIELVDPLTGEVVQTAVSGTIDLDDDGEIDPLTEVGYYEFISVRHGQYQLRTFIPPGWSITLPSLSYNEVLSEVDTLDHNHAVTLEFADVLMPVSDGMLTLKVVGDLDLSSEYITVSIDGQSLGNFFVDDGLQYVQVDVAIPIDQADLAAMAEDGTITVTVQASLAVDNLAGTESVTVELGYVTVERYDLTIAPGEEFHSGSFGLAPPEINVPPMLTAVSSLGGAVEDTSFIISYELLAAAADEFDSEGQPISFLIDLIQSGIVTKAGRDIIPGTTLLGPGEFVTWTPDANANGLIDAFVVKAWDAKDASAMGVIVQVDVAAVNDAPTLSVVATLLDAVENEPYTISYNDLALAADEADVEGSPISFRIEWISSGTLTLDGQAVSPGFTLVSAGGILTWLPAPEANGTVEAFSITAWDGALSSVTPVPVNVDVEPFNHLPTLTMMAVLDGAVEDVPFIFSYADLASAGNEIDFDGDELFFRIESVTAGSLTSGGVAVEPGITLIGAGDTLRWSAPADDNGVIEAFTVVAWDGEAPSASRVPVLVDVSPVNDAPTAQDDQLQSSEDTPANTPNVLGNDFDIDGDSLAITGFTQPLHGLTADNADGTFAYTPDANYSGPDSFTYTVSDGKGGLSVATVWISVGPANDPPTVVDDAITTNEDTALTTTNVLDNDSDIEGDSLTITGFTQPGRGTVMFNGGGVFTYTPDANFHGQDSFTYTVSDGRGGSTSGTVEVTINPVNDPPIAVGDNLVTTSDAQVTTADVTANDIDIDGDSLSVIDFTQPLAGGVSYNGDGTFTYTPRAGFWGDDSFTYTVSDGFGGLAVAKVNITVQFENNPPTVADDSAVTDEDTAVTTANVLANDVDADGQSLTISSYSDPVHGTVVYLGSGRFTYRPAPDFFGVDGFTYTAIDGQGGSATATVAITVTAVNDAPTTVADFFAAVEDTPLTTTSVLANDFDVEADSFTVSSFSQPANGTVTHVGEGVFIYTSASDFTGDDTFTYWAEDSVGDSSSAVVTITVSPVDDAPIAGDDFMFTPEDTPATSLNVLANDVDPDGGVLVVGSYNQPANGSVLYNNDGTFTYTPNTNFNGIDTFTYWAEDTAGDSSSAVVTITVAPIDDAPIAGDDFMFTPEDTPATSLNVLANDVDPDGGVLVVGSYNQPANGSILYNNDGTFTYTPNTNFNGVDTFTYTVSDLGGGVDIGIVSVNVAPVNDVPLASDQFAIVVVGQVAEIVLTGFDVETDTSQLSYQILSYSDKASLTIEGNLVTYVAQGVGDQTFTYTVTDLGEPFGDSESVLTSAPAEVTVSVRPIPQTWSSAIFWQKQLRYRDADGTLVKLSLRGDGIAEARFRGDNIASIEGRSYLEITGSNLILEELLIRGTSSRSSLTITTDRGGDSRAQIDRISASGALKSITGKRMDLIESLSIGGLVKAVTLGNVTGPAQIELNVGGTAASLRDSVTLKFGRVRDLLLETNGLGIRSLTSIEWLDTDGTTDSITSPWINSLAVKGQRANSRLARPALAGDFQADLIVSGQNLTAGRPALGSVKVAGSLIGSNWNVTGDAKAIKVAGQINAWQFYAHSLKSLRAGDIQNAQVEVYGYLGSARVSQWLAGSIKAGYVGSIKSTGRRANSNRGISGLSGDFNASVTITGISLVGSKPAFGSGLVAGSVVGSAWQVSGQARSVKIKGSISGWSFTSHLSKSLIFGDVVSANLTISGSVNSIKAYRWQGGKITADSINKLVVTGLSRGAVIPGDFKGDLDLAGLGVTAGRPTLGTVIVAGDLAQANWLVGGDINKLTVKGSAIETQIRTSGNIGGVVLGAANGFDILAGVGPGENRFIANLGEFYNTQSYIKSLKIVGLKLPRGTAQGRLLIDSNFSAASLGSVSIMNVASWASGSLHALSGEQSPIGQINYLDTITGEKWSWRPGEVIPVVGNFMTIIPN